MQQNVVDFLVGVFGSQLKVAQAACVKQPTVAGWKETNAIPFKRIPKILKSARKQGLTLTADDLVTRSWGDA